MTIDAVAWSIVARNLPEHARNPIHTDEGAQSAGFARALVAGVTSYAYALHPILHRFGLDWVGRGSAELRLRTPVFDGDLVRFPVVTADGGRVRVEARPARLAEPALTVDTDDTVPTDSTRPPVRPGEPCAPVTVTLAGEYGSGYAERAGDPLALCSDAGVVHPAVWPALANQVFHTQLARGAWVHTRSSVRHHALAPEGAQAVVETVVVRRYERSGERAVADVTVTVEGVVVATLEHEAIVALPARRIG